MSLICGNAFNETFFIYSKSGIDLRAKGIIDFNLITFKNSEINNNKWFKKGKEQNVNENKQDERDEYFFLFKCYAIKVKDSLTK